MSRELKSLLIVIISSVVLLSCDTKNDDTLKSKNQEVQQSVPAVCVWDKGSVRAEPSRNGKWLSSMALGEKVTWLGQTEVDSSDENRKYYKIELSDSTMGWCSEYVVALDAQPSAIIKKASIHRRPDILTVTDETFEPMEMAAIVQRQNDWLKVIGPEKKKSGWVKQDAVSLEEVDIAAGVLCYKALQEKDRDKRKEKIEAIINSDSFSGSVFIQELKELLHRISNPVDSEN